MNPLEPPKLPKKSKKVIFRDLKIRAGVLKVALKIFSVGFWSKIGAFNQEKDLERAFSVIVKTDGSFAALVDNYIR